MIRYWFAAALMLAAPAAAQQASAGHAQAQPTAERWLLSERLVAFVPAHVAFPLRAGVLGAVRHQELSAEGEAIDNAIQYRSADGQVFGTVYIYYPGLPHAGISAFATAEAIRSNSETVVETRGSRIVAAGGVPDVAIRTDFANYRGGNASSAAFVKAGRWIIKLRVTGPEARRAEVDAAMDALLGEIMWGSNPPQPAMPVTVRDCPAGEGARPAGRVTDPDTGEVAALGLLATFDGAGIEATTESGAHERLPSRVPAEFCLSSRVRIGESSVPMLRSAPGDAPSIDGRTRLLAIISDSGTWLELIERQGDHILLLHSIGETAVLGLFDGVPSDDQIAAIIDGRDRESARPRARVRLRPGRNDELLISAPPAGTRPPRT